MPALSKYYSFINHYTIEGNVVHDIGYMVICPPSFRNSKVIVRVFFKDHCDFMYSVTVFKKGRTYVPIAAFYEGKHVYVICPRLKKQYDKEEYDKVKKQLQNDKVYKKLI